MSESPPPEPTPVHAPAPINAPPAGGGTHMAPRSEAFQRFMAAPLIVASVLMVATATLAVLAWIGGTADGERLQIDLQGSCAPSSLPLLAARADELGLGDPRVSEVAGGVRIEATMPGTADDEAQHVPELLARRGALTAGPPTAPIFTRDNLELAQIRLDESGLPYTWLELDDTALAALAAAAEADPDGEMALQVDHVTAPPRPFHKTVSDGGIRLLPGDGPTRDRMRVAADHAIVLTHGPLPCDWRVGSVSTVAGGEDQG